MAGMEAALTEIIEAIKAGTPIDEAWLSKLLRRHNRDAHDATFENLNTEDINAMRKHEDTRNNTHVIERWRK